MTMEQLAREWGARNQDQDDSTVMQPVMANAMPQQPENSSEDDFDLVLRNACTAALQKGLVTDLEDLLVVTAGLPFGTPGAANM